MNAYAAYKSLTAEQKQLLRHKQIAGDRTPDAWLAVLGPVANYDVVGDKTRKRGLALLVVGIIMLFINFFFNRGFYGRTSITHSLLWALTGALIVSGAVIYLMTKSLDLQLDLRRFVLPVLTVLREDMTPDTPLHLNMDLRGGTIKEKLVKESEPYTGGAYHRIVDSFYTDPWMEGRATLIDGSRLQWKVIDRIRKRRKTKRNARGKTKSKTITKQKTHLLVQVGLPGKRYGLAGDAGAAPQQQQQTEITVEPGDKRSTVKVHRVIQTDAASALEPGHFLEAVGEAFKRAVPTPSRS